MSFTTGIQAATDPYTLRPGGPRYDVQSLLIRAEQGDKRAAFLLGSRYASGRDTTRDDSEALRWFTQAAQAGLAEAQYNLGVMYAQGRGVPRSIPLAVDWYTRAAQQDLAIAQFNLGTLYSTGGGVPRNEAKAAEWMERAANKGIAQAQFNLAIFYEYGRGVRLNAAKAMHWYRKAEEFGYAPAKIRRLRLQHLLEVPADLQASAALQPAPALPAAVTASAAQALAVAKAQTNPVSPVQGDGADAEQLAKQPSAPAKVNESGNWLAGLDPGHYTLQLASYVDRKAAERFIQDLKVPGQGGIYASTKLGKRWFSVVYGDYADYQAARAATRQLPAALRGIKPWVRKVSLIKEEMD